MPERDYATSYLTARQQFLTAATPTATFIKSWQHPLRGIAGERLYLDLAWFGDAAASKVLVLLSGTHGVEGFCGSGIQTGSIERGWQLQADREVAIAMIYGINPYGMSHFRRVDEAGVDLNRNFIDFQQPRPSNKFYDNLADAIVPRQWTQATQVQTFERIMEYLHHQPTAIGELARGQYHYWYAPFFGGEVPSWSNRVLNRIIDRYLLHKIVGVLDYHTGLGKYATGQLMYLPSSDRQSHLASKTWGDKLVVTGSANSVAAYCPQGTLIARLQQRIATCIAATYEFGTIPEAEVFHALRADHWLHAYGDLNGKQAHEIKQQMLDTFYCDRLDWQESVFNLAMTAQEELLQGLLTI